MFKSNFGVTGCLPWKERDNGVTTGGCTLETRFDSMGLVSIGGCQNSDTGGPGYVNISGGCCINDPPPECITKSTDKIDKIGKTDKIGNSKLNTGYSECDNYQSYGGGLTNCSTKLYDTPNDCRICKQTNILQGTYAPPPTVFNKPLPNQPIQRPQQSVQSSQRPQQSVQSNQRKRPKINYIKKNKSNFGNNINISLIVIVLIAILLFYLYKNKKLPGMRSFGKRR